MTDIRALAAELENDPLGVGYEGLNNPQAASAVNAQTRPNPQPVPASDIKMYLFTRGLWLPIKADRRAAATQAKDALEMFDSFRVQRPDVAQAVAGVLDALIADGLATAEHKAEVLAMGAGSMSRAEELDLLKGSKRVTSVDVGRARRWYINRG